MANKPVPIIEYQPDIQRTPREVYEVLEEEIDKVDRIVVMYIRDGRVYYIPGDIKRNYTYALIHWDLHQLTSGMINDKFIDA